VPWQSQMDVNSFASELLRSLAEADTFRRVALQTEGPVVSGYAHTENEETFLRFYFNEITATIAFALIAGQRRVWGIDRDNRRGWHLHPEENPSEHVNIGSLTVPEIVERLHRVVLRHV